MRFFLQGNLDRLNDLKELTRHEYFDDVEPDEKRAAMVAPFTNQADYAYFAVKFGWTKDQYYSLTPVERLFIIKEIETQEVQKQELMQATFETAIANVMRKKGKKYRKLWKKKRKEAELPISMAEAKKVKAAIAAMFKKNKTE